MVHCILKGTCFPIYTHKTRTEEATKALVQQQQQIWSIIWMGYESISHSLHLLVSFRFVSFLFASLHFTSLVRLYVRNDTWIFNEYVNQSKLERTHTLLLCATNFLTSLHPFHYCCCCCCYFLSSLFFFILKSNSKIICTVRLYCLHVFTCFSQLLAVSRCLFFKNRYYRFFIAFNRFKAETTAGKKSKQHLFLHCIESVLWAKREQNENKMDWINRISWIQNNHMHRSWDENENQWVNQN